MIVIRPAQIQDAPKIARVHIESWKTTYRGIVPDAFLESLDPATRAKQFAEELIAASPDRFIFVGEDERRELVGFVSGGKERKGLEPGTGELYAIYLLKERQRQGNGKRLLKACSDELKRRGYGKMVLFTMEENAYKGFYESVGGVLEPCDQGVEIGGQQFKLLKYAWNI